MDIISIFVTIFDSFYLTVAVWSFFNFHSLILWYSKEFYRASIISSKSVICLCPIHFPPHPIHQSLRELVILQSSLLYFLLSFFLKDGRCVEKEYLFQSISQSSELWVTLFSWRNERYILSFLCVWAQKSEVKVEYTMKSLNSC